MRTRIHSSVIHNGQTQKQRQCETTQDEGVSKCCTHGGDGGTASPTRRTWVWASPGGRRGQDARRAAVRGAAKGRTQLSHWTTTTSKAKEHDHSA